MSQRDVERTLGRLVTDERFRGDFFGDPQSAVLRAGLDLSREELDALSCVPRAAVAALGARIDGRICRLHVADHLISEEQRR
jgi:hypothetical protein